VRDEHGAMVRGKSAVSAGQHLSLQFADGTVAVQEASGGPAPAKPKPKPSPATQGALF
jgi:antitoxin ParD1/3/4